MQAELRALEPTWLRWSHSASARSSATTSSPQLSRPGSPNSAA